MAPYSLKISLSATGDAFPPNLIAGIVIGTVFFFSVTISLCTLARRRARPGYNNTPDPSRATPLYLVNASPAIVQSTRTNGRALGITPNNASPLPLHVMRLSRGRDIAVMRSPLMLTSATSGAAETGDCSGQDTRSVLSTPPPIYDGQNRQRAMDIVLGRSFF